MSSCDWLRNKMNVLFLGYLTLILNLVFGIENTINLQQGQLFGSSFKTRTGRNFTAFQGIPYAKPPIGDLRFKDPVPAEPWSGVLNATSEPNMCLQKSVLFYKVSGVLSGSEDCLYLNVYIPQNPNERDEKLLPVMVWIPGGGFRGGHGGISVYGPHYLLDEDVVIVSMNYRIGIFGFLSTEDNILPGNYGMKDQVLALKWVRDNIKEFGGDPNKVTIFGESAGGASVGLHLLSPMSKGLFHKAIMGSGTPLCPWAISPPGWAKRRAEALSTIIGCPKDLKQFPECLRKVPAELLVDLLNSFSEWLIFPFVTFNAVVENCENRNESFLCKYPFDDFKQESNVPVLIGANSEEGGIFVARMYNESGLIYPELKNDFNSYAPSLLQYKYLVNMSDIPLIGEKIFNRFFPDGDINDPFKAVKLVSGAYFLHGINAMAVKLSSKTNYYYVYNHVNQFTFASLFGPYPKKLGSTHGDDLISLFTIHGLPWVKGEDLKISKLMVKIWTQFATTDKLTINGTTCGEPWPIFDNNDMNYVSIQTSQSVIQQKPFMDDYQFWNDLLIWSK